MNQVWLINQNLKGFILLVFISIIIGDELKINFTSGAINERHLENQHFHENLIDFNNEKNDFRSKEEAAADVQDDKSSGDIKDKLNRERNLQLDPQNTDVDSDDDDDLPKQDSESSLTDQNLNSTDKNSKNEVYLGLNDFLKMFMPHHPSLLEESINIDKKTSGDINPSSEDINKDEDLPNSGSGISYNSPFINSTSNDSLTLAESNVTQGNNVSSQTKKAVCLESEELTVIGDVEIVNSTTLQKILQNNSNITSRSTPAKCYLVYFFSPYCPFSAQGSAYVNALARSLPNIAVYGLDSVEHHSINARYSIMGTPSLVLFHNGNVAGRYNASEFGTAHLESFVHHYTDQTILSINVTTQDFKANLPSQSLASSPFALYVAWAFLLLCGGYMFLNSEFYAKLTETFVNNWREAEAQHEHDD